MPDDRSVFHAALAGLLASSDLSLVQLGEFCAEIVEAMSTRGLAIRDAVGFAMPRAGLPRDSAFFCNAKTFGSLRKPWQNAFSKLFTQRAPLLKKLRQNGQPLDPEELNERIEVNAAEMCPAFHQDANVMRLLCTYAGPGTEWLPEPSVDRSELGLQGRTPADANAAIASGPSRHSLPGEVLILTGSKFDERGVGAIHKSPSAELGSRLFVAIDPLDDDPGCRDGCC